MSLFSLSPSLLERSCPANNFSHSGPTLEEIAKIFDGDAAEVGTAEVKGNEFMSSGRTGSIAQYSVDSHEMKARDFTQRESA